MREIQDERIKKIDGKFVATCVCGKIVAFATKLGARNMLSRGNCRNCKRDYRNIDSNIDIYKNKDGKWCSTCSGCGIEQAYTRKDHAKQSHIADWQCKKCVAHSKGFSSNRPIGNEGRMYNRFKKSAINRRIKFSLTQEEFFQDFNGACSLTKWPISIAYEDQTASVDRIDNDKGYEPGNIQWVHVMVNMSRGKKTMAEFVEMCKAIAENANI